MNTVKQLTVLYDPTCGFCVRCRRWLEKQAKRIEMRFVPQGSGRQESLYPNLIYKKDEQGRPDELIVIDDNGKLYRDDKAWVMCFYALRDYRGLAMRLAKPGMAGLARRAYSLISGNRRAISLIFGASNDQQVRQALETEPEEPRCNNALCALREAKAKTKAASEEGVAS